MVRTTHLWALAAIVLTAWGSAAAPPESTFSYQGVLTDGGSPADGRYDLRFRLFDAATGGGEVGLVKLDDELVRGGRITAELDFGDVFDGRALWLQLEIRPGASGGTFTTLLPRQGLTGAAHALVAGRAGHAAMAGSAITADDTDTLAGEHGAYYRAWSSLTGVPAGLGDGDDDVLGTLGCHAGEIAAWSGSAWICAADEGTAFSRTTVVHGTGDAAADGAVLLAAVDALPLAGSQVGARRVRLEAGVYDLGDQTLSIGPWVVLEGAGRETTVVTSAVCSATAFPGPVIAVESDAELRDLTVVNTCGSPSGKGSAVTIDGDRARLTRVTARDVTPADRCMGVWVYGNSAVLERVIAEADGGTAWTSGIEIFGSAALLLDCDASATGGGYHNALLVGGWTRVMGGSFTADHAAGTGDSAIEISAAAELYDVTVDGEDDAIRLSVYNNISVTMSRVDLHGGISAGVGSGDSLGLFIEHSRIDADGPTIDGDSGAAIVVSATQLFGDPVQADGGLVSCVGVWDESWTFYPNTCP